MEAKYYAVPLYPQYPFRPSKVVGFENPQYPHHDKKIKNLGFS